MSESDFQFPTAPSFTESAFPPPPTRGSKDIDTYVKEIEKYLQVQLVGLTEMQASLTEGWIVDGLRVTNLTAANIFANNIITETLYLGSDGNGSITLSSIPIRIIIKDEAGTNRVEIGDFGASNTDWGIKVSDASGTVKFQSTTVTFMDGAIITNATIQDAKIVDLNGTKLVNSTVGNAKISDMSASKINVGTLVVDGSPAITVTSSGALVFSAGGDIIMRATSTNFSYIFFQNSAASTLGTIGLSSNAFTIESATTLNLRSGSSSTIFIGGSTGTTTIGTTSNYRITASGRFQSDLNPAIHNNWNLGLSSLRWAQIWGVLINGADYCFEDDARLVEAYRVYSWYQPGDAWMFMSPDWEPLWMIKKNGDMIVKGEVHCNRCAGVKGDRFPKPDVQKQEREDGEIHGRE